MEAAAWAKQVAGGALPSRRPHTRNALDDAVEQGEPSQNPFRWDG
ncbi:hypothetical protein ACN3XK_21615 [Actinomadura welshii]